MEKVIHLQLPLEGEQEDIELQGNESQRFAVKVCCKLHKQDLKQKDLVFHRHDALFSKPLKPKGNLHITTEGLLHWYVISAS